MVLKIQKKSLSPIISTVLLVVVAVILVTLILTWGKDFTNKSLESSKEIINIKEATIGLFSLKSIQNNTVILKNLSDIDYNILGYTIVSSDYNSDYFWINKYHPFENLVTFTSGNFSFFPVICIPDNKFKLQLHDDQGNIYYTNITPVVNLNNTTCKEYNVPLWEFEAKTGSYVINSYSKNLEPLISTVNFISEWQKNSSYVINVTANSFEIINTNGYGPIKQLFEIGKKYYYEISGNTSATEIRLVNDTSGISNTIINLEIIDGVFNTSGTFFATNINLYLRANIGITTINKLEIKEVDPLETITDGTRYLQNTKIGTICFPSSQAYGTWEFDFYKVPNDTYFFFINSNTLIADNNGYDFQTHANGAWYFHTVTNGYRSAKPYNNDNYFINNNWYRFKITRTHSDLFSIYVKGGNFDYTDWQLITAKFDSNPFTNDTYKASNFFLLNFLGTGAKITNIKIIPEIEP